MQSEVSDREPFLPRWRGVNEAVIALIVPRGRNAELLAALCDKGVREAILAIHVPHIATIVRQAGGDA